MSNFDIAFEKLIGNEGKYSNNPRDPGGETCWGITIRVARANGYNGKMEEMPIEEAKRIYNLRYWFDWMNDIEYKKVFNIFDMVVNSGSFQTVKTIQRACGFKEQDGIFGTNTNKALKEIEVNKFIALFNAYRLDFLNDLHQWDSFSEGWSQRIANNIIYSVNYNGF